MGQAVRSPYTRADATNNASGTRLPPRKRQPPPLTSLRHTGPALLQEKNSPAGSRKWRPVATVRALAAFPVGVFLAASPPRRPPLYHGLQKHCICRSMFIS